MAADQKYKNIIKNSDVKDKFVYLLIRGCTHPPKDVQVAKKKGTKNGNYLQGMTIDMMNMEQYCNKRENSSFYNAISNNNMTAASVLQEISTACKYAKFNKAKFLNIYYTGHGETDTGNWIFKDKVVSLKDVMITIQTHWGKSHFRLHCDCCFSGNWVLQLSNYKHELDTVWIYAASWPGKVAYDDPKTGGYWTHMWTSGDHSRNFFYCSGIVYNKKWDISYQSEGNIIC
eukprot:302940_1